MQKPYIALRAVKISHLEVGGIGPRTESCVTCYDLSPWYRVCNKEIFIPKGSYGYGESRYVFSKSVQYSDLPVLVVQIPRLEGGGIGLRKESCVICEGPIEMVPC